MADGDMTTDIVMPIILTCVVRGKHRRHYFGNIVKGISFKALYKRIEISYSCLSFPGIVTVLVCTLKISERLVYCGGCVCTNAVYVRVCVYFCFRVQTMAVKENAFNESCRSAWPCFLWVCKMEE